MPILVIVKLCLREGINLYLRCYIQKPEQDIVSLFKQSHKTHLVLKFSKLQLHAQVNFQY